MNTAAVDTAPRISFEVPGGQLRFGEGDLDVWAEHLVWCYRMLGVADGSTIAVQDYGTSPLSYLGSALLMPTLAAGVAERIDGRLICLDASAERVVITPDAIRQVDPDVLVVRADVFGLLLDCARRSGVDLAAAEGLALIVAVGADPVPLPPGKWRRLLHIESSLLLAPECDSCGCFHLRENFYAAADGQFDNLLLDGATSTAARLELADKHCDRGSGDLLVKLGLPGENEHSRGHG